MKVAFGFLLNKEILNEHLWVDYLNGVDESKYTLICHCHSGIKVDSNLNFKQTKTVQTSWAQTINAHFEIYKEFLKDEDNKKLMILSESCIPWRTFDEFYTFCTKDNCSYFTKLSPSAWITKRLNNCQPEFTKKAVDHEQWVLLDRQHIEVLLENEDEIKNAFKKVFADNEHFTGTSLNYYGYVDEIKKERIIFTKWRESKRHPDTFKTISQIENEVNNSGAFFARKFNKMKDDKLYYPKKGETAVILHIWYTEQIDEMAEWLNNIPFDFKVYVTLPDLKASSSVLEQIENKIPNHRTTHIVENRGADIGALFHLLKFEKELEKYKYYIKIHTKRDVKLPKRNKKWRDELINPLVNPTNISKFTNILDNYMMAGNGELIGGRFFQNKTNFINILKDKFGIEYDKSNNKFIAGTMFWFNSKFFDILKNIDIDYKDFQFGYKYDGRLEHSIERIFGYLVYHNNSTIYPLIYDTIRNKPKRIYKDIKLNNKNMKKKNNTNKNITVNQFIQNIVNEKEYKKVLSIGNNFKLNNAETESTNDWRTFFNNIHHRVKFDLIYVDCDHTIKELSELWKLLQKRTTKNGIVVFDDALPPTEWHQRDKKNYKYPEEWCGDVWKFVYTLYDKNNNSVNVYNVGYGQAVVDMSLIDIFVFEVDDNLNYKQNYEMYKQKIMIDGSNFS